MSCNGRSRRGSGAVRHGGRGVISFVKDGYGRVCRSWNGTSMWVTESCVQAVLFWFGTLRQHLAGLGLAV